jgi:CRP-like cAMP-binding protein
MKKTHQVDPRVTLLRRMDLFRQCSEEELDEVSRLTCESHFAAGVALCRQGQVGRQAFVILDGQGIVTVDGVMVAAVGVGDIVGETALLDTATRVATVTALTPMRVLVLSVTEFNELLYAAPTATRRMLVHLGRRVQNANRALVNATS